MTELSGNGELPKIDAGFLASAKTDTTNVTMTAINAGALATSQQLATTVADAITSLDTNISEDIKNAGGRDTLAMSIQETLSAGAEAFPNMDTQVNSAPTTSPTVQSSNKGMNV